MRSHESRGRGHGRRVWATHRRVRVGLVVLGVWLTVAPHVLEYRAAGAPVRASINDSLVGILVVALALLTLLMPAGLSRRDR